MRLLLVEDDRELANSLKELLEEEGFRVRLALSENGVSFLDYNGKLYPSKLEWVSPKLDPKTSQGVMRFVVSNADGKLKDELRANIPIKDALVVMLNIPFAVVGGVIALYVSGYNLSVPSAVEFIAVFGIATLNGVVLLSYARKPFVVLPLVYEMLAKK